MLLHTQMGLKRKSNIVKAARISMFVQHANFPECWGCWGGALDCLLRQGGGLQVAHVATFITCVVDPPLALVNKRLLGRFSIKIWKIFKTFASRDRSGSVFIWQNPSILEYRLHCVGDLKGNTEGVFSSGCLWRVGASLYLRYKQSPVESTSSQFSHLGMFVLV